MTLFLDRIDAVPVSNSDFEIEMLQWFSVLVDTLNEDILNIQNAFNYLKATNYTATEIATLNIEGLLTDGIVLYDTTNNFYVGMQGGLLTKFTTTAYP